MGAVTRWVAGVLLLVGHLAWAATPLEEEVKLRGATAARLTWVGRELQAEGRATIGARRSLAQAGGVAREEALKLLGAAVVLGRVADDYRVDRFVETDNAFAQRLERVLAGATCSPARRDGDEAVVEARLPLFAADAQQVTVGRLLYARPEVVAPEVSPWPGAPATASGLLLDARGKGAPGAFAPRVLDSAGRVVWTAECADRQTLERAGAVEYGADWDTARQRGRAGAQPLVVPVVSVAGADLVVSVADGERIAPVAPRNVSAWCFAAFDRIRLITPVSPVKNVGCVSTAAPEK